MFGSESFEFGERLFRQAAAFTPAPTRENALDFTTSVIVGSKPKDAFEAMLAAQMAAVHLATMRVAGTLSGAQFPRQIGSAGRSLNQLARTFAMQMDTLKRDRSSGQQVVVKHVTVNEGGQAIVGDVRTGGGTR